MTRESGTHWLNLSSVFTQRVMGDLIRRGPLIVFGLLLAGLAWRAPNLFSLTSIQSSLIQASPIAIVAFGLAMVVIGGGDDVVVGGIDPSIPASAALATAILSDQLTNQNASFLQAFGLALVAAIGVGLVNAVLVTVVGLAPILATLATYSSVVGIIKVLTTNRRINVEILRINTFNKLIKFSFFSLIIF